MPVPTPVCTNVCDEVVNLECIVYTGEDNDCYGIKNGDSVASILQLIFEKVSGINCSCDFGSAIFVDISTTTTTTTIPTTSTTTVLDQSLCFVLGSVIEQMPEEGFETITITPAPTLINNRIYYQFNFGSNTYRIFWDGSKWVLILTSNPFTNLAVLNSNIPVPIGDLYTSWEILVEAFSFVTTRTTCTSPIYVNTKQSSNPDIDFNKCYKFYSYWNTTSSLGNKPEYIAIPDVLPTGKVRWNSFTNVYEFFEAYPTNKIAFTTSANAINSNWVIYPTWSTQYFKVASSFFTKCEQCDSPIKHIFNTLYDQMPYIAHYLVNCDGDEVILYSTKTTISVGDVMYSSIEPTPIVLANIGVYCQNNGLFNNCISISSGGVVGSTSASCL
jgi:hypothetical protein